MPKTSSAEKVYIPQQSADLPINSRVAVAIVADPNSQIGEKIQVLRSVRNDPLADMHSRGVVDDAEFMAGRKWQKLYECTQIGPISAIDPGKEAVDGGKFPEAITDEQIDAFREIGKADMRLGQIGGQLMRQLLAQHLTIGQMSEIHGLKTGRQQNFLSLRVRECLNDLGIMWGFVGSR